MRQTKKWLAGLVCAALLLSLLPAATFAVDTGIYRDEAAQKVADAFGLTGMPFTDVDGCTEAQIEAITALRAAGIINGTSETTFDPDGVVQRYAAAVAIWRATGAVNDTTAPQVFEDVTADDFYAPAINNLYADGVLTDADADAEGNFNPEVYAVSADVQGWLVKIAKNPNFAADGSDKSDLTRAEFAELLVDALVPFEDISNCTSAQRAAIKALNLVGYVNGTDPTHFTPDAVPPRYEAVILLARASGADMNAPAQTLFNDVNNVFPDNAAANEMLIKCFNGLVENGALTAADADENGNFNPNNGMTSAALESWIGRLCGDTPDTPEALTRAEAAEMICAALEIPEGTPDTPFTDISGCTAAQQAAINSLAAAGIVSGTEPGIFDPDGVLTRVQAAILIWRATGAETGAPEQTIFSDVAAGDFYAEAVNCLVKAGILTADDADAGGCFSPNGILTAEPFDAWLERAQSAVGGDDGDQPGGNQPGGSVPVAPGGGSQTGGSTTTEQNPDGSTTTTTTDPSTGTVTETTERTDGSSTTVETAADGTVTTTDKSADGSTVKTVANADGSSETSVELADGTVAASTTDASGSTTASVTISENAAKTAASSGSAITLPIPAVTAAAAGGNAPTVTVALAAGGSAKVEIPVDGATVGTVAIIVRADGTEEIVKASVATENGVMLNVSDGDTLKIVDNTRTFDDVADDYWGADAVTFAASRELFNGTGEGTFSPNGSMTRAMLVTVLARFDGVDTGTGSTWYEAGAEWAVANGISDGANLDAPITREQLAAMLYRYAGSPEVTGSIGGFEDAGSVSGYAADAMRWAVETGLITGVGGDMLNPTGDARRAEVATILMRFCEKMI